MKALKQSTYFLLGVVATASAASRNIFERQSTCGAVGFSQCSQAGLPSNFCCGSGQSCILLAANTTLLCCPEGKICVTIEPIPCDLSVQNATQFPEAVVKTTALTGTMAKCGGACCPFGYSCNGENNCVRNSDQSQAPAASSSSVSPTSKPSSSPSASRATASATSQASTTPASQSSGTSSSTPLPVSASCDKFPAGAILIGFFSGLVAGILLTVASVCLLGARRRRAARRESNSSFGNISDPQPVPDYNNRTDFLRKPPTTPSTTAAGSAQGTVQRVKSLFRKSNSTMGSSRTPVIPAMSQNGRSLSSRGRSDASGPPRTPPMQRQPSYEDINIFVDNDTASASRERIPRGQHTYLTPVQPLNLNGKKRAERQTTFTDMIERSMNEQSTLAGLPKGQPYVYHGRANSNASIRRT